MIKIKRVYEEASEADGYRVLVDRLWPRGVKKASAAIAEWSKEAAPSAPLRQWFNHEPAKFPEFRRRYMEELEASGAAEQLRHRPGTITLVYSAADTEHNQAVVLKEFLER